MEANDLASRLSESELRADALTDSVGRLQREVRAWSDRMTNIERRFPVRLYRLARRLTGH
jgi:hypothetical protein